MEAGEGCRWGLGVPVEVEKHKRVVVKRDWGAGTGGSGWVAVWAGKKSQKGSVDGHRPVWFKPREQVL